MYLPSHEDLLKIVVQCLLVDVFSLEYMEIWLYSKREWIICAIMPVGKMHWELFGSKMLQVEEH